MADFKDTIRILEEQRRELLEQAAAIDRAIGALKGLDRVGVGRSVAPAAPPPQGPRAVASSPRRRLSQEHKRKIAEGRRRALAARTAAPEAPATPATADWGSEEPSGPAGNDGEPPAAQPLLEGA
jgi:hypothetical protein